MDGPDHFPCRFPYPYLCWPCRRPHTQRLPPTTPTRTTASSCTATSSSPPSSRPRSMHPKKWSQAGAQVQTWKGVGSGNFDFRRQASRLWLSVNLALIGEAGTPRERPPWEAPENAWPGLRRWRDDPPIFSPSSRRLKSQKKTPIKLFGQAILERMWPTPVATAEDPAGNQLMSVDLGLDKSRPWAATCLQGTKIHAGGFLKA